ncbi:MAG: hypothetical protein RIS51_400, partial [Actinomycetota bacterium]
MLYSKVSPEAKRKHLREKLQSGKTL